MKNWIDPPLDLHCAKRLWRTKIHQLLSDKKNLKEIGTTAEK